MKSTSLSYFVNKVEDQWGPISSSLCEAVRSSLADLSLASSSEPWLRSINYAENQNRLLHKSPTQGFCLLTHEEEEGLYRIPHDHGRAWVVYAVQSGKAQIETFGKFTDEAGRTFLVRRDCYSLVPGQAKIYLPGDIHATLCMSEKVRMFRFTSCDLEIEKKLGYMRKYNPLEGGYSEVILG